jgi:hypothetical protein
MRRPHWDFDYRPIPSLTADGENAFDDLVVATDQDIDPAQVVSTLGVLSEEIRAETVLSSHPLFWTRVRTSRPLDRAQCAERLRATGVGVRYVASTRFGSQDLPPPLDVGQALPRAGSRWPTRAATRHEEPRTPERWFLGELGVNVSRAVCGTGAGTRLAVIDHDAGRIDQLELDGEILVGVAQPPRGSCHSAQLVAWATRAKAFVGVAPDASARLYFIPKPGEDVLALALAIARAVDDGADVVLCATNVDGQASPMLDDALEVAVHLGRGGRGAAVVMPCSREPSSPAGSVHSSFSLGMGEPAADPRILCVGPSGRSGGWFWWRDRFGRLHPFANRGPALRWLAPGDDLAWPFEGAVRMAHAESSGASALAAGVLLLVLGRNAELTLAELDATITSTVAEPTVLGSAEQAALADPSDALPRVTDRDGHDAKHGYGRMSATRACLAVADPLAAALVAIGEDEAAEAWILREDVQAARRSDALARWMARVMLADAGARHAACAVARTLRLVSRDPIRMEDQIAGSLLRQLDLLLRALCRSPRAPAASPALLEETRALRAAVAAHAADRTGLAGFHAEVGVLACDLWAARSTSERVARPALDPSPEAERLRA